MRTLVNRILNVFRGHRLDRELDEEVGLHLSMLEEEFRARGMSPAEAKLAARREFGGVARTQETYRGHRGIPWLESTLKDVRYALRGLRRNPGFTAAAVISLALGIGANTAVFSLFYALMVRTLPVARPDELLSLRKTGAMNVVSYPLYREIAQRTDLFSSVLARTNVSTPDFGARPDAAAGEYVSGNYFGVLGIAPAAGRLFTEADNRRGNSLAVLSFDYWQRRYGGDPGVVGRMTGQYQVIGVAAPGFRGIDLDHHTEIWFPAAMYPGEIENANMSWVSLMARRRPEVSEKRVQAALDVLVARHFQQLWGNSSDPTMRKEAAEQRIVVEDGGIGVSLVRDRFGKPLTMLMAAAGLVLLASCANVANLLLARGAARRREIALRFSLGATRARLVRQALVESAMLAAAGSALGVLFAVWGRRYVLHFLPAFSGNPFDAPDRMALAFAVGVSLLSVALFGLMPALRSTAVDPAVGLRNDVGRPGGGRGALRGAVVTAQVAFSVVLVALATLFGSSLAELRMADLGFRDRNVIGFTLYLPSAQKSAEESFLARVEAMPGVTSVSSGNSGPYPSRIGGSASGNIRVPGSEKTARDPARVDMRRVADRYFETIGGTVLAGREFNRGDAGSAWDEIAIVNQAFVREFMPGEVNPTGRTFSFDNGRGGGKPTRIVGVARDLAHRGVLEKAGPTVYTRIERANGGYILVASKLPPSALLPTLRRDVARFGSQGVVSEPQTLSHEIDESIYQDRILAGLSGFFGVVALLLTGVGLYGVVAYKTAQRTGEIGIRIALGAERASVMWLVLRDALVLVALGLAIGLPAAAVAARAAGAIVFGVRTRDPRLFAATALALFAVGAAAALLPARRAAAIDPMQALRHE